MGPWFRALWLVAGCAGETGESGKDGDAGGESGGPGGRDSDDSVGDSEPDSAGGIGDSAADTAECVETAWYRDSDGDGVGRDEPPTWACEPPSGHVANHLDCDDEHALARPGAFDRPLDGVDGDCDRQFGVTDIRSAPTWRFRGEADSEEWSSGHVGNSLATGDFTGDGRADIVVGTAGNWYGGDSRQSGATFVFSGPLRAARAAQSRDEAAASLLLADDDEAEFLCAVPDVDGDGNPELAVANPYNGEHVNAGVVYVVDTPLSGFVDVPAVARTFRGHHDNANLGPCAAGDFDGDGLGDLVLTSMYEHVGQDTLGRVYLMLGPIQHDDIDEAELILEGAFNDEALGASVVNAGDVDGDGAPDFVLTTAANTKDDSDMVAYLLTDKPSGVVEAASVAAVLDYTTGSESGTMQLTAGQVGDINGDGYADVGIGEDSDGESFWVLAGPISSGATRVVSDDYLARFYSLSLGESKLTTAARLGDWNGDGEAADDFALANMHFEPATAPPERECGSLDHACWAGAVFIVAGPVAPGTYDLERQADRLEMPYLWAVFGHALAGGADLDADGSPDLAVGAPQHDEGAAYVVFGGGDALPPAH